VVPGSGCLTSVETRPQSDSKFKLTELVQVAICEISFHAQRHSRSTPCRTLNNNLRDVGHCMGCYNRVGPALVGLWYPGHDGSMQC
jgi:hypothetical protein